MGPFLEIIWSPNTVFNNSIVSAAACGAGGSGSTVEGIHLVKKKKKNSSNMCIVPVANSIDCNMSVIITNEEIRPYDASSMKTTLNGGLLGM